VNEGNTCDVCHLRVAPHLSRHLNCNPPDPKAQAFDELCQYINAEKLMILVAFLDELDASGGFGPNPGNEVQHDLTEAAHILQQFEVTPTDAVDALEHQRMFKGGSAPCKNCNESLVVCAFRENGACCNDCVHVEEKEPTLGDASD
jgi:hypothetical protein